MLVIRAAPANDHFEERTRLEEGPTLITGTLQGATLQLGEPAVDPNQIGGSVWFEWVCPASGRWTLETFDARGFSWSSQWFTGTRLDDLVKPPSEDNNGRVFQLTQGDRLILQVVSRNTSTGPFQIRLALPPANDDFVNRYVLIGEDASFPVETFSATRETGEWAAFEDYWATTWFEWTAPSSGPFEILGTVDTPSLAVVHLDLLQGTSVSNLTFLRRAYYSYSSPTVRPSFGFRVIQGQSYLLRPRSYQTANVHGYLYFRKAPAYNDFAGRRTVSGSSFVDEFYSVVDYGEPGEPTFGEFSPLGSSWWEWICPSTGAYQLSSVEYSRVGVFRGDALDHLETRAFSEGQAVAFHAEVGERLIFMTDIRWANSAFSGALRLESTAASDSFDHAIRLTGLSVTTNFPVLLPTREPGEPPASKPDIGSRWFRWKAPASGNFGLAMGSGAGAASLRVYQGETLSNLGLMAESPFTTDPLTQLSFLAEAGIEYSISIETPSRSDRAYSRIHALFLRAAATNDLFEARPELPLLGFGRLYGLQGSNFGARTEIGEPPSAHGTNAASVWFNWIAPESGWFHCSMEKPPGRSTNSISIFRGGRLTELQPVPPLRHRDEPNLEDYRFEAIQGVEYAIRVATPWQGMGEFSIRLAPSPRNDDLAKRQRLTGNEDSGQSSNEGATTEIADPFSNSVWWGWTAPSDGMCEVEVVAGDTGSNPAAVLYAISKGLPLHSLGSASAVETNRVRFQVRVAAGREYAIAAGNPNQINSTTLTVQVKLTPRSRLGGSWLPAGWDLSVEGKDRWTNQTEVRHDGHDSVEANFDGFRDRGFLRTTIIGPGTFSFWWKLDAAVRLPEPRYELYDVGFLFLVVNGSNVLGQEGVADWSRASFYLPEGTHDVAWTAIGFLFPGHAGKGWISQIEFESAAPAGSFRIFPADAGRGHLVVDYESSLAFEIERSTDLVQWESWISPEELRGLSSRSPDFSKSQALVPVDWNGTISRSFFRVSPR